MKPQSYKATCQRLKQTVARIIFCLATLSAGRGGAAAEPVIIPQPQKIKLGASATAAKSYSLKFDNSVPASTVNEYNARLKQWGFKNATGSLEISLVNIPISECEKVGIPPRQKKTAFEISALQTYFLSVADKTVEVKACGEDGFFYALMTFKRLWEDADPGTIALQSAAITDYPAFPVRGVFEGGYGIWEKEGRLNVIDWMGQSKLNTYLYGPKGDPKIRRRWRAAYDDIELFEMKRVIERCQRNHIQFGYVIAPTLGFEYGSDEDFKTLIKKLRPIQALGAKTFVIAFDDTLGMLFSPADREKYTSLADAEAAITNKLYNELKKFDPEAVVVIVPEIYAGVSPMEYTETLVKKLLPEIYIGWTGNQIGAPSFTSADIEAFTKFYGRSPSFGDNWGSLFPILARDKDTYKHMTQFALNPYNIQGEMPIPGFKAESEASLMPIEGASLAEFAWNPEAYDPDATLEKAAKQHCPESARGVYKMVVYKDFYDFAAYYPLKTDYRTPIEIAARKALESKSPADATALANEFLPQFENAISKHKEILSACYDPEMSKQLSSRAANSKLYFEALTSSLITAKEAAAKNDAAQIENSLKAFLKALKEEK